MGDLHAAESLADHLNKQSAAKFREKFCSSIVTAVRTRYTSEGYHLFMPGVNLLSISGQVQDSAAVLLDTQS